MGRYGINERLRLGSGSDLHWLCGKQKFSLASVFDEGEALVKEQLAKINLIQNEA